MNLFIPSALGKSIIDFGAAGTEWLNNLPARIADLERAWNIRVGPALDHGGAVSWVAPVELADGSEAVLKIGIPDAEARFEADALRFLDGRGAVRLLRVSDDGFSLLLECCFPGTDLRPLSEDEGDAIASEILPGLWRETPQSAPFVPLADFVAEWWTDLPRITARGGYEPELAARAVALGRDLAASQPRHVFLHGDFHPGNVLAAQREPWLVIDPKPLVGEPAYDLAQWLHNRYAAACQSTDPAAVLRRQVDRFAARLGLDPARIAGWAFVKALGWVWEPQVVRTFCTVSEDWQERENYLCPLASARESE